MTFLIFSQGGSSPDETPTPYVSLLSAAKEEPENNLSSIISEYLPDFINSENLMFVNFIEAYYEWSGRKENPHGTSATLMDTKDIERTLDTSQLPISLLKDLAYKNIKRISVILLTSQLLIS